MSHVRYTIILPKYSLEQPVSADTLQAFAQLFNIGEEQARQLFSQAPIPLKKEIDALTAKKFVYALKRIEVEVKVVQCSSHDSLELPNMPPPLLDYRFTVSGAPHGAFVSIQVPQGKGIRTEASTLITVSDNLHMATRMDGGFGLRLTADTLFLNEFHCTDGTGSIGIAPALPGDIVHIYLAQGQTLYLCSNNYLASSPEVLLDNAPQQVALRDILECQGPGDLWFHSGGVALPMEVNSYLYVRPDRLVAWSGDLLCHNPETQGFGGSPEDFSALCKLTGRGRLWLQTCSEEAIAQWCNSLV